MDTIIRCTPRSNVIRVLLQSRGYAPTAREIGSSAGYLHDIAHGRKTNPSVEVLQSIADALGVHLDDIADVTRAAEVA